MGNNFNTNECFPPPPKHCETTLQTDCGSQQHTLSTLNLDVGRAQWRQKEKRANGVKRHKGWGKTSSNYGLTKEGRFHAGLVSPRWLSGIKWTDRETE